MYGCVSLSRVQERCLNKTESQGEAGLPILMTAQKTLDHPARTQVPFQGFPPATRQRAK